VLIVYVAVAHRPGYPELPEKLPPFMSALRRVGALVRGTRGAEVMDELKPLPEEIQVTNSCLSGFTNTDLDLVLKNKGIKNIVVTGIATNIAVESTVRDAVGRGYFPYILDDACVGVTDEMHAWAVQNIFPMLGGVLTSEEYIRALGIKAGSRG